MTPEWPLPAGVRSCCSERAGGVSAPPWDTLNLGDHVGDDPLAVAENRRRFAMQLGARPVFLKQVHGRGVVRLDTDTADGTEADACWTTQRGVACTMMVADCLPVLLTDRNGDVVGAAHCGWRGLAGGVLEALHAQMRGAGAGELLAWLGPCIGPGAFEVGAEVRDAFLAPDPEAGPLFRPHAQGKFLADLPGLARRRLAALGVPAVHGNDGSAAWCTVGNPSRFFSHRRDRVSGRFAAAVWRA
ncbi:peptidoglycan editing factor PgeF [Ramlibacter sp. USB13]|uniref:Purine nucleoside phosphorylase n=1 Tax=Ramlibacter cellulosilyticus TaxID=2764187 RepID=A0A923MVR3_9BURK|nr:peptidoglycan editing factor PgeF [Ramlibacter cellulosilyticus]MBC5785956.1 peptidoglycan editing factor PgeF [Ramlibacter cellulosilyticus]